MAQNIAEKRFAVDASERTFFVEIGGLQDRQVMEEARGNLGVNRSACAMPRGVKRPWSRLKKAPREMRRTHLVVFSVRKRSRDFLWRHFCCFSRHETGLEAINVNEFGVASRMRKVSRASC